ncbi:hypothetical protein [Bacillus sp. KH172YL63]|uniref:hypothetical protein n=1 Tax=Bacillus sp. KH172YL63 TaxID=2709784 RepID=UPI001566B7F0|nr:hypothetical protein [Bacillus sp. KH172YL63]
MIGRQKPPVFMKNGLFLVMDGGFLYGIVGLKGFLRVAAGLGCAIWWVARCSERAEIFRQRAHISGLQLI